MDHGGRRCPNSRPGWRAAKRQADKGRASAAGAATPTTGNTTPDAPEFDLVDVSAVADHVGTLLGGIRPGLVDHPDTKAARDALDSRFGSVEAASTWVGAQLAAEADRRCGVNIDTERAALAAERAAYDTDLVDATADKERHSEAIIAVLRRPGAPDPDDLDTAQKAWQAAYNREQQLREHAQFQVLAGVTDRSATAHRALADSYTQVLSEVRPLGGDLGWHPNTPAKVRAAFADATAPYPADWVAAASEGPQPVGKLSTARAHYSRVTTETRKRRVPKTMTYTVTAADVDTWEKDALGGVAMGSTPDEVARVRAKLAANPGREVAATIHFYDTRRIYEGDDDTTPPRGRGWERHDDTLNGRRYWRRQKTEMQTAGWVSAPVITTSDKGVQYVAGRPGTYGTSVHELAHRFEHTVPGINRLERAFLDRRAAGQEPTPIYPHKATRRSRTAPEIGYADNLPLHYAGKVYHDDHGEDEGEHYEVLSCGTQALFGGRHGGLVGLHGRGTEYARDDDYRAFTLGVLACAGRTPPPRA